MFSRLCFFCCLSAIILWPRIALAQEVSISGNVTHQEMAVPYALIKVHSVRDTMPPKNVWSDSLGRYHFSVPRDNGYLISASYIGYKDFVSDTIRITDEDYTLPIILKTESAQLQDVVVNAQKRVFETDKGKIIFNVQNSGLSTGQTALDLLKSVPGVSVSQTDEIQFRGSAGVNMMVDGKMTYLSGTQLANYLKSLNAEDLAKIELITAPTSEFDAEGNAGIINIILRKNRKQGYAVDVRSVISKNKLWKNNQNVTSSFSGKNWEANAMLDYNTPITYFNSHGGNSLNIAGNTLLLRRQNTMLWQSKFYTWRLGGAWQFLPKHKIAMEYHGYLDNFKSRANSSVRLLEPSGGLRSSLHAINDLTEPYHFDALHFSYAFKIDSLGKNITADADYTSYRNFSDGLITTQNYAANGDFVNETQLKSHQPGFVKIKSTKIDADLPFNSVQVKMGIKYAQVNNDNNYRFERLHSDGFEEVPDMSSHYKYNEDIAAAYFSASKKWNKTRIQTGLRAEYTNAHSYTADNKFDNRYKYTKFFPSLSIEQSVDDNNKLDLALSRRINRPSYADLNPVRWYRDEYFYFSGNPDLVPETSWIGSLTYSLHQKYVFTTTYNLSNDFITRKVSIDDNGSVRTQSANFGQRNRFDFTAAIPVQIFPFWSMQFFTDISHTAYNLLMKSGEKRLARWSFTGSLQQDIQLPESFKLNIAANVTSAELRGIYITKPSQFVDIGLRKTFFQGKLATQFSVSDIFSTTKYKATSLTDIADYFYNDKPYAPMLSLSLTYHFGGKLIKSGNMKTEEQERL